MSEQQQPPLSEATIVTRPVGAEPDDTELSDADLEHVVGGLARAWLVSDEQWLGGGGGGDGAGAYNGLEL